MRDHGTSLFYPNTPLTPSLLELVVHGLHINDVQTRLTQCPRPCLAHHVMKRLKLSGFKQPVLLGARWDEISTTYEEQQGGCILNFTSGDTVEYS